jgi:hypothetical protein
MTSPAVRLLAHGFTRVRCQTGHDEIVVAFSCSDAAPLPELHSPRSNGALPQS